MSAALGGFKPFKILHIFSRYVLKCWKFQYLDTALLSQEGATLDSVETLGEGGSLDTKFCARLEE